jgi:SPX domain protein involved in polyphosphate accumulation
MARRLELKYLVDRTTRTALELDLRRLMRPDCHAGQDGAYRVRSLYLDTPDFLCYRQKLAGMGARHKLRLRAYGDDPSASELVRLEVKSRKASFIHKTVLDVPREDYPSLYESIVRKTMPEGWLESAETPKEFFRLQRQYNMEPKVLLQYRRTAFERREISRCRANLDDEIVCTRNLDLLGPMAGARRVLQYGHAVFEIKVDDFMPFWMHALIVKYDLQAQAFSKYCYAVRSECRLSGIAREQFDYA